MRHCVVASGHDAGAASRNDTESVRMVTCAFRLGSAGWPSWALGFAPGAAETAPANASRGLHDHTDRATAKGNGNCKLATD
jgi:hypothetical protein